MASPLQQTVLHAISPPASPYLPPLPRHGRTAVVSSNGTKESACPLTALSCSPHLEPCSLCLDDVLPSGMITIDACGHRYCYGCLRAYCSAQVASGVVPICCPALAASASASLVADAAHGYPCSNPLPDEKLFLLLPPVVFQRYKKLGALRENVNLRECPRCSRLQVVWQWHLAPVACRVPDTRARGCVDVGARVAD